jgi:hypothetical protein
MFNFHLNDLMYLVWMLDFYERVPLTKVARPKNEPGGLLADLAPQYSDKLAEPDKASTHPVTAPG